MPALRKAVIRHTLLNPCMSGMSEEELAPPKRSRSGSPGNILPLMNLVYTLCPLLREAQFNRGGRRLEFPMPTSVGAAGPCTCILRIQHRTKRRSHLGELVVSHVVFVQDNPQGRVAIATGLLQA